MKQSNTSSENRKQARKYFRRYLKIAPLSVSLCRSIEAINFAKITMSRPILDIGCGFGEFARVFFEKPVEMGLDNSKSDLDAAKKVNKYKKLILADARNLPFFDNSYKTIMSVSTVEHIRYPYKFFKEAYRVLKPNGKLVLSMETNLVDENMFIYRFFKKLKLFSLNKFYIKTFNKIFHRQTLLSKKRWESQITNAGFKIVHSQEIVSPKVIHLYELFFVTACVSQILKPLFGRRLVWRPKIVTDFLTNVFLKYICEEKEGTVLFLVAKKDPVKKIGKE